MVCLFGTVKVEKLIALPICCGFWPPLPLGAVLMLVWPVGWPFFNW